MPQATLVIEHCTPSPSTIPGDFGNASWVVWLLSRLPHISVLIDGFQYSKIFTWLRGLGE